ncbi:MAG: hypothetical protein EOO90_03805 [Pedobacter sp.]|nr:MAG: hypothetical protein EOO90_03805 [Pedobacter sp.]
MTGLNPKHKINPELIEALKIELEQLKDSLLADQSLEGNIGLYTGGAGHCLFFAQRFLSSNEYEALALVHDYMDSLASALDSNERLDLSFSSGMAGCGWVIEYLVEKDVIDPASSEVFDEIDNVFFKDMKRRLMIGDLDQINGAIGIARYFLKKGKYQFVEFTIEHLDQVKITEKDEFKWVTCGLDEDVDYYNFGLAHGIPGIMHFLRECYDRQICAETCLRLMKGGVLALLNNIQDYQTARSYFPNTIPATEYKSGSNRFQTSRMAWCYGDMGVFYCLFSLADILPELQLKKIAFDGFMTIANKKDIEITVLIDPGFCHGTVGVAYIFFKMWLKTGETKLKIAAEYWLWETIKLKSNNEYQFLTGSFKDRKFQHRSNLLEGSCGVAMVYLSILNPHLTSWDECLLMN